MRREILSMTLWLLSLYAAACSANRVEPGLANVPALGGASPLEAQAHDVVANAEDSCPQPPLPGREQGRDPLVIRLSQCTGAVERRAPTGDVQLLSAHVEAPRAVDSWNFHLEGLPPCEAPIGPAVPEGKPPCTR